MISYLLRIFGFREEEKPITIHSLYGGAYKRSTKIAAFTLLDLFPSIVEKSLVALKKEKKSLEEANTCSENLPLLLDLVNTLLMFHYQMQAPIENNKQIPVFFDEITDDLIRECDCLCIDIYNLLDKNGLQPNRKKSVFDLFDKYSDKMIKQRLTDGKKNKQN